MSNDFNDLGRILNAMLSRSKPSERRKAFLAASKKLRSINAKRIGANIEPSGEAMTPRAKKTLFEPKTQARFLYPSKGTGDVRLVVLSSWTVSGNSITGYDEKRKAKRSFDKNKIKRWLPSTEAAAPLSQKIKSKLETRKGKMFQKLKLAKNLKNKVTNDAIEVGFFKGNTARVARVSQYGLVDKVLHKTNIRAKYPKRELLGLSKIDENELVDTALSIIGF